MEEAEFTPKNSLAQTALTNGLLTGFVLILIFLIFYLMKDPTNQIATYSNYVIMVAGIIYSTIVWKRDGLGGYISYGQAVGIGSFTMLFTAILNSVFIFVFFQFIDPNASQMFLAEAEEQMLRSSPAMSDEQIDAALAFSARMFNPAILSIISFFSTSFLGLIFSLITSAFLKKKNPDDF